MLEGCTSGYDAPGDEFSHCTFDPLAALPALKTLILEDFLVEAGLRQLGAMTQLTCLGLQSVRPLWQGFDQGGAEWLATLTNLQRLDLESTRMRDANVAALGRLPGLRMLNLGHNPRVRSIAPLAGMSQLRWLGLCQCDRVVDADCVQPRVAVSWEEADLTWFAEA